MLNAKPQSRKAAKLGNVISLTRNCWASADLELWQTTVGAGASTLRLGVFAPWR